MDLEKILSFIDVECNDCDRVTGHMLIDKNYESSISYEKGKEPVFSSKTTYTYQCRKCRSIYYVHEKRKEDYILPDKIDRRKNGKH